MHSLKRLASIFKSTWFGCLTVGVLPVMMVWAPTSYAMEMRSLCKVQADWEEMQALEKKLNDEGRATNWRHVMRYIRKPEQLTCSPWTDSGTPCQTVKVRYALFAETSFGVVTIRIAQKRWDYDFPGGIKLTDYCPKN